MERKQFTYGDLDQIYHILRAIRINLPKDDAVFTALQTALVAITTRAFGETVATAVHTEWPYTLGYDDPHFYAHCCEEEDESNA